LLDIGEPRARALELDQAGLVEQDLSETDVAPLGVGGEELLELRAPRTARRAIALPDQEDGDRRLHELAPVGAVHLLETRHGQPTNCWPFCQSAPQRPPLLSAWTVRRTSFGLRPTLRSLIATLRTMPLSSTMTVAR